MKDYYGILGVPKTASSDEVKSAYRKAAMKHHPDRGGDEKKFKEISEAYDILSNNEKRGMLDQGVDPTNPNERVYRSQGGFGGFRDVEDLFGGFGFNFGFGPQGFRTQQPQHRNKSLNVTMSLTLEEAFTGVNKSISIKYPGGKDKVVNINIPPGIDNGMAIRYAGMGDDSITGVAPGDLTIVINVENHPVFAREGLNLLTDVNITCFDAILGTTADINTLDGRTLQIIIPAGTQPNTTLGVKNEGMKDNNNRVGKLYVRIGITIPTITDPNKQQLIRQLRT
jgi:curved DNA-binding protein